MAPDPDDSDDPQAANVSDHGGSEPGPAPVADAAGPRHPGSPGTEGGDADTQGTVGTIASGTAEEASVTVFVAEGRDADTEGTIAEVRDPATEGLTTGDETDPLPAGDSGDQDRPHEAGPEAVVPPTTDDVGAAPGPEETASVGFDGLPLPDDGGAPPDEAATDDSGSGDLPAPPRSPDGPEPRRRTKAVVVLTVLSLLVVGAGVGVLIWSRTRSDKAPATPPRTQTSSPSPTLSDGAFVTFNDPETGMSIRYPRGWTRSEAPVREIRLLVSDGKQYSALVRVTHTDVVTTPANLANIKAVTDGIVGPGAQILKEDPITVNGLIGFRYIYTLTDATSGLVTAHLHYFLFQGHKMNSIVFEAVPSESFDRIAGVFDQMLGSFHSDPEPP